MATDALLVEECSDGLAFQAGYIVDAFTAVRQEQAARLAVTAASDVIDEVIRGTGNQAERPLMIHLIRIIETSTCDIKGCIQKEQIAGQAYWTLNPVERIDTGPVYHGASVLQGRIEVTWENLDI